MMRKILGLDLGSSSIGWALIQEDKNETSICDLGVRAIPLDTDEKNGFNQGKGISKNQNRTAARTARKTLNRYQLRRKALRIQLEKMQMMPSTELWQLSSLELYKLRSNAVKNPISLQELGRVWLHMNQKRGYKSPSKGYSEDKKETAYVAEVMNKYNKLKKANLTIGQYFYNELNNSLIGSSHFTTYRIKDQIFPRQAYLEEFEAIWETQSKAHPNILTKEFKEIIQNAIIFYQRPLKSQKGLVSVCEFEGMERRIKTTRGEKSVFIGPKVAPRSNPLFQVVKVWETIHNIRLKNKRGVELEITLDNKKRIFDYLHTNENLTYSELIKILNVSKTEYAGNKQLVKGIQGNATYIAISNILGEGHPLLQFELNIDLFDQEVSHLDRNTGEVLGNNKLKILNDSIEKQPLYILWHTLYSIKDETECFNALKKNFNIDDHHANLLSKIDFNRLGYGNRSVKAMRKIYPYLAEGFDYSTAASFAGYNHSFTLTKDENERRVLRDTLELLPKNSLRQPVVEKILNQMINLVNCVIAKYGRPDEIRIELARELKQSKEERNKAFKENESRERENDKIKESLKHYQVNATRKNIIKYRLFHEIKKEDSKLNAQCIYCGQSFGISDALNGDEIDVEHIIPKAYLFDDSQSNKTLSHRKCNAEKRDNTAMDYMATKGDIVMNAYIERVNELFKKNIISRTKKDKLLMTKDSIPQDFIDRQLRQTQYISKKAKSILEQVCVNVWSTSGSVTEKLRKLWGWEDALMDIEFEKYKNLNLTEYVEWESNGKTHRKEVIPGWSKRDDLRHHAMDALTIACTKQGFIQRLNTLNSQHTRSEMSSIVENSGREFRDKLTLLEKYLITQKPFTTNQVQNALSNVIISIKSGKKVATKGINIINRKGKNKFIQKNIIIPRGALSEESIYGRIKILEKNVVIDKLFDDIEMIENPYIKSLIKERFEANHKNKKNTLKSIKKSPIFLDSDKNIELKVANRYSYEYVKKIPLASIKQNKADKIVDEKIKNLVVERLAAHNNNVVSAYSEPLYYDQDKSIKIKSVRCKTGLTSLEPVPVYDSENKIHYQNFYKPGNNHHIALYKDSEGNWHEHIVTFWHAVERKIHKLPVIIKQNSQVWKAIYENLDKYPESFLSKLPDPEWIFIESFQQNEMFILGLSHDEFYDFLTSGSISGISKHLYRVQKISKANYVFRHHIESTVEESNNAINLKKYYIVRSLKSFQSLNPIKIRINILGKIVSDKHPNSDG
jgi:CRISPR-associated endonuclease Csn1